VGIPYACALAENGIRFIEKQDPVFMFGAVE
jgi:hypothetical protein